MTWCLNRLMLHHLPGDLKQRGLAEMRRVLKPGGICLVVDFEPPKSGLLMIVVKNHMTPMAHVDVRDVCAAAGAGRVYRYRNRADQLEAAVVREGEGRQGSDRNNNFRSFINFGSFFN